MKRYCVRSLSSHGVQVTVNKDDVVRSEFEIWTITAPTQ